MPRGVAEPSHRHAVAAAQDLSRGGDLVSQLCGVEGDQVGVADSLCVQLPPGGDHASDLSVSQAPLGRGQAADLDVLDAYPSELFEDRQGVGVLGLVAVVERDDDRLAGSQRRAARPVGVDLVERDGMPTGGLERLHLGGELFGWYVQARERRACRRRVDHVIHQARPGAPRHHRVRLGVVADRHPHSQLALERCVEVVDHEPDLEERRGRVQACQLVKQLGRVGSWAVIECERDLAALIAAGGDEGLPREQPVNRVVLTREQLTGGGRATPRPVDGRSGRFPGLVVDRADGVVSTTVGDHHDQSSAVATAVSAAARRRRICACRRARAADLGAGRSRIVGSRLLRLRLVDISSGV